MTAVRRCLGRLLLLVGATTLLASATTTVKAPPAARAQGGAEPLREVQAVLDARVAALAKGDRAGWLATVDPQAPASLREAQARSFDGLRSLPLATFSLTARVDDSGDLSHGLASRYGGAQVFLPETRQVMRFEGYDDRDAIDSLLLTFVERGGKWYVGGDSDLEAVGLDPYRALWDFGPVELRRTPHFLVLSHPEQSERARALAAIAEEAVGILAERWDRPWSGRIPMIVPGSVEELEDLLQSTIDLEKFVAFVVYGGVRDRDYQATAPRIFIQDRNLSRHPRAFQLETLVHELSHAAAVPLAGPFVPAWVHEGLAEWIANDRPDASGRPSGSDGHLPRDYEFVTGSGRSILLAYEESRTAVSFLATRKGGRAPADLFTALGAVKSAPGNVDHHVDVALRQVTGEGLAEFERAWGRPR